MELKKGFNRLVVVTLTIFLVSCSHLQEAPKDGKREIASQKNESLSVQDLRVLKSVEQCNIEMLKDALSNGGNPNAKSSLYAIEFAIESQNTNCVEILVKAGASLDPHGKDEKKIMTPITRSIYKTNLEMVKLLLKLGAPLHASSSLSGKMYTFPMGHALISSAKDHFQMAELLLLEPKSHWYGDEFWKIVFNIETSENFPWLKKLVSVPSKDEWNSPEVLSMAIDKEGPLGRMNRTNYLLEKGISPGYINCEECSHNFIRNEPLHRAMASISDPELTIEIGNKLLAKGAKFKFISVHFQYVSGDIQDRNYYESIQFIKSGKILKWALMNGYTDFDLNDLAVNDHKSILKDKESLQALAQYYPTKSDYYLLFLLFYHTYSKPVLSEAQLRTSLELIKARTPNFSNLMMKLVEIKGVPINRNAIELVKSYGFENADFKFIARDNTDVEKAVIMKAYGSTDAGVLIGRNLNDTAKLIKAGYSPNYKASLNDAWIEAATAEKWDVADYLGKNGYLAEKINGTSPLILAAWGTERHHHSSVAWFNRAMQSYPKFSSNEKINWIVLSLIKKEMTFEQLLSLQSLHKLDLNEPVLIAPERNDTIVVSSWIKNYTSLEKLSIFQSYLKYSEKSNLRYSDKSNSKTFFNNELKLIKLGADLKLPLQFGKLLEKGQFEETSHYFPFEINAKIPWTDYADWVQFLQVFISQKGDLLTEFFLPIVDNGYTYSFESPYNILYLNKADLLKHFLTAAKQSGKKINLNIQASQITKTFNDQQEKSFCSLSPLMMNALLSGDKIDLTKLFIEAGAEPNMESKCKAKQIAYSYAIESKNELIAAFLKGYLQ